MPHLALELYDLALYQRILNTPANFQHQTDIDVYEIYHGMRGMMEISFLVAAFGSRSAFISSRLLTCYRMVKKPRRSGHWAILRGNDLLVQI